MPRTDNPPSAANSRAARSASGYRALLTQTNAKPSTASAPKPAAVPKAASDQKKRKLSYKEQREFDALPARIEAVEAEARDLQQRMAQPDFYKEGASAITEALARVEQLHAERDALYARWAELEPRPLN